MTTFFKDFYADWRDKTGSGYFTLFLLSNLALWNWRAILILFAGDLTTDDKLERISAVSGFGHSFIAPVLIAILVCLGFATMHAGLSYLLSGIELWRKGHLATQSARLKYTRKMAEAEQEVVFEAKRQAVLKAREKNAQAELEVLGKEEKIERAKVLEGNSEDIEIARNLDDNERGVLRIFSVNEGKAKLNKDKLSLVTPRGVVPFTDHQSATLFKSALESTKGRGLIEQSTIPFDGWFELTGRGYRVLSVVKQILGEYPAVS